MARILTYDSVSDPQTTQEFWDLAHSKDEPANLTGSSGTHEWRNLRAVELVKPGRRVLNIGVGLGRGTIELAAAGCQVSVLDISPVALNRVRANVEAAYLPETLARMPDRYFDLALSHLVVQHMSDEALFGQLTHVIRSLKENGIFALQFSTAWNQEAGTIRYEAANYEARPHCRTLARMMEFAESAGASIVHAEVVARFPRYEMSWYAAHLIPKSGFHSYESSQKHLERMHAIEQRDQARAELRAIQNSRSFRWTRPLRTVADILRKII